MMALSLCAAAIGGPMNDLAHIDVIQNRFPPDRLVGVVRFRMAMESLGMLMFMLVAPALFSWWGTRFVMGFAGGITVLVGGVGLWRFAESS